MRISRQGARAVVSDRLAGARIVDSIEAAVEATQQAAYMDRRKVRAEFEKRFTAAGMARAYVAAYRSLLAPVPATREIAEFYTPPRGPREVSPCEARRHAGLEPGGLRR